MKYKKYPSYKDSGVQWLGEIPSEWNTKKLKYIADIQTGTTPSTSNELYFNDDKGTPWVKPDDLKGLISISKSKKYLTNDGVKVSRLIRAGSVLVCGIGTIGKYGIAGVDLTTNQQINAVTFNSTLHDEYGKYLVDASKDELDKYSNGNVVKILNTESQKNISHAYPPLQEQQQIAKFLDNATQKMDTLIQKQENLIKLLKEKRQAVISHAVTRGLNPDVKFKDSGVEWLGSIPEHWSVSKIGYHAFVTKLTGFEYTNLWKTSEEGEIIALRGFNIKERKLDLSKTENITISLSNKLSRSKLSSGDIVFPCTGTIGNAAIIEINNRFHINQNIAKISFNSSINPLYAVYWLLSSFIKKTIDKNNMSGMQPVVLIGDIRNLPLVRINYSEQKEIANYLDNKTQKIDTLIKKATKSIKLLKEKRTALISAAVTGKIDVRAKNI